MRPYNRLLSSVPFVGHGGGRAASNLLKPGSSSHDSRPAQAGVAIGIVTEKTAPPAGASR